MKRLIFSAVLACAAAPAIAADEYRWHGHITEEGGALSYAIPDSDGIKLDFHCERKTRKIVVTYEHEPQGIKDKDKVFVRFSLRGRNPGPALTLHAAAERLDLNDTFILVGETRMGADLRQLLTEGGTLLVTVNGRSEEIPLAGIAKQTRYLFAACPS